MPALLATLLLATLAADPVGSAVRAALARPGARAEVASVRVSSGQDCTPGRARALKAIEASGEVPLRLEGESHGAPCEGWAFARVRVFAPGVRMTRGVRAGEPLAGAVEPGDAEVLAGRPPLAALPPGAVAARALRAGAAVVEGDLRDGPAPGSDVVVVVRAGAVQLETHGRAIPCARGRACARLDGNRRVEGTWTGDRILVEAP